MPSKYYIFSFQLLSSLHSCPNFPL